jgi:hypothetical protein
MSLNQHIPPPPLEEAVSPSHHLGSSMRPEKVHCTVLPHILYVIICAFIVYFTTQIQFLYSVISFNANFSSLSNQLFDHCSFII